jgi:hypothetical protein
VLDQVNSTSSNVTALDLDTGNGGIEHLGIDTVAQEGVDLKGTYRSYIDVELFPVILTGVSFCFEDIGGASVISSSS